MSQKFRSSKKSKKTTEDIELSRTVVKMKLARFDVHSKAVDGVNQQTAIGAFVTVIMYCLISFLVYSEMNLRTKNNLVSRMVLDASGSSRRASSTRIEFDVDFYEISCDRLTFAQEITRGEHHNATSRIDKVVSGSGTKERCRMHGSLVTDKVGGNFRFEVTALKVQAKVKINGTAAEIAASLSQQQVYDQTPPNISHKINRIVFVEIDSEKDPQKVDSRTQSSTFPSLENHPLNGQESVIPLGIGIQQYSIQVVPTTYRPTKGKPKLLNQYSVTERQVDFMQALAGVTVAGQFFSDFVGIVITYDFYPVSAVAV